MDNVVDTEVDEDDSDQEYNPLSYKKLIKFIETYHPRHPDTKKQFSGMDRITIKGYYWRLFDLCFCYAVVNYMGKLKKNLVKKWKKWRKYGKGE